MHFHTSAVVIVTALSSVVAQDPATFNPCISKCSNAISGCILGGGNDLTSCGCFEDQAFPDSKEASCLRKCVEDADLDPDKVFAPSCDAIFQDDDDDDDSDGDDSSNSDETGSGTRTTGGSQSSPTENYVTEEQPDETDAASLTEAPMIMALGGLLAALLL